MTPMLIWNRSTRRRSGCLTVAFSKSMPMPTRRKVMIAGEHLAKRRRPNEQRMEREFNLAVQKHVFKVCAGLHLSGVNVAGVRHPGYVARG